MIEQAQLEAVVRAARERFEPRRILLFGSQARGDSHAASGLDLCLIVGEAGDWLERQIEFRRALDLPGVQVEPYVFGAAEFERLRADGDPFVLHILEEGRLLYEQQ
jgi:predicted nucleotidyltransferase